MAIKPQDCLVLTSEEAKLVKNLEETIDCELRERYVRKGISVEINISYKINDRVFDKISNLYSKSGWQVKLTVKPSNGLDKSYSEGTSILTFKEQDTLYSQISGGDMRDNACPPPWQDR